MRVAIGSEVALGRLVEEFVKEQHHVFYGLKADIAVPEEDEHPEQAHQGNRHSKCTLLYRICSTDHRNPGDGHEGQEVVGGVVVNGAEHQAVHADGAQQPPQG